LTQFGYTTRVSYNPPPIPTPEPIAAKELGAIEFREFTFELIRHQQAIADKLGINLTDFKVLGLLHRRGKMTPKELAETVDMSAAAMTTVIDRLEQAGYVERERRGADRRSFTVHATKGSESKVERLYKSLRVASQSLLPHYTPAETALMAEFFTKSIEILRTATAKLRGP
jgi:DNA-binding MarR family transcriptional regulator